uniref:Uncharacterized protein n=2 Tax=Lotharella globosa TaxID=91324 RepID=A0A7S3YY26_9EUKA|mmetsp:Transcript_6891/g.12822  ORF Transcript_6891/g.12822 Transcript_6891/m.12822 type:complete len:131 (+) Transcript_6891:298-690(+)
MALCPPVWFFVMNDRVKHCHERIARVEKSGVNVFSEDFDAEARRLGSVEAALDALLAEKEERQERKIPKKNATEVCRSQSPDNRTSPTTLAPHAMSRRREKHVQNGKKGLEAREEDGRGRGRGRKPALHE